MIGFLEAQVFRVVNGDIERCFLALPRCKTSHNVTDSKDRKMYVQFICNREIIPRRIQQVDLSSACVLHIFGFITERFRRASANSVRASTHRAVGVPVVSLDGVELEEHLGEDDDGRPDERDVAEQEVQLRDGQTDDQHHDQHHVHSRHLQGKDCLTLRAS